LKLHDQIYVNYFAYIEVFEFGCLCWSYSIVHVHVRCWTLILSIWNSSITTTSLNYFMYSVSSWLKTVMMFVTCAFHHWFKIKFGSWTAQFKMTDWYTSIKDWSSLAWENYTALNIYSLLLLMNFLQSKLKLTTPHSMSFSKHNMLYQSGQNALFDVAIMEWGVAKQRVNEEVYTIFY
jgi:hypothetical protein